MGTLIQWSVKHLPLKADSVDMVFTDPPYTRSMLETYKWLAEESARVLSPGGVLAAMTGINGLDRIFCWFSGAGLQYYGLYSLYLAGNAGTGIVWRNAPGRLSMPIAARLKHVLVFSKGPTVSRTPTTNLIYPGRADKRWHPWGQDIESHRYFIDCFTVPGDLVLDPMCGGGTTAVVCEMLGRRWIVGNIDTRALHATGARLCGYEGAFLDPLPLFAYARSCRGTRDILPDGTPEEDEA